MPATGHQPADPSQRRAAFSWTTATSTAGITRTPQSSPEQNNATGTGHSCLVRFKVTTASPLAGASPSGVGRPDRRTSNLKWQIPCDRPQRSGRLGHDPLRGKISEGSDKCSVQLFGFGAGVSSAGVSALVVAASKAARIDCKPRAVGESQDAEYWQDDRRRRRDDVLVVCEGPQ